MRKIDPTLKLILKILIAWMSEAKMSIIEIAQETIDLFDDEDLPDWLNVLANGNPDALDDVIAVALADYEEAQHASDL